MSRGLVLSSAGFIAHHDPVDVICCACGDTIVERMTEQAIALELWESGELVVNLAMHGCTNPEIIDRRPLVALITSADVESMRRSVPHV